MSAGFPYLQKQRKSNLTDIAFSVGLKDYESLKKSELEVALDEHLRTNQTTYAGNKDLADYFKRFTSRTSPVKLAEERKPRGRRPTIKAVEEVEEEEEEDEEEEDEEEGEEEEESTSDSEPTSVNSLGSTSIVPRTPVSDLKLTQRVRNLPPSPAVMANAIENQTNRIRTAITKAWSTSHITETVESTRERLSSVTSIEILILALELFFLYPELLPLKIFTTIPTIATLHNPEYPIRLPDLFLLISGEFWAPFSLWLLTSGLCPLLFAYFFNLSLTTKGTKAHPALSIKFDPLIFNITKGLVSFLVYARHFTFWDTYLHYTIERVASHLPGGWPGTLTGAAIGGAGSLYEAVLRK